MTKTVEAYTQDIIGLLKKGVQAPEILASLLRNYSAGRWGIFTCGRNHRPFCQRVLRRYDQFVDPETAKDKTKLDRTTVFQHNPEMDKVSFSEKKVIYLIGCINFYVVDINTINKNGDFANLLAAFRDVFPKYGYHFNQKVKDHIPAPKSFFEKIKSYFSSLIASKAPEKKATEARENVDLEALLKKRGIILRDPNVLNYTGHESSIFERQDDEDAEEIKEEAKEEKTTPWDPLESKSVGVKTYSDRICEVISYQEELSRADKSSTPIVLTVGQMQAKNEREEPILASYLYNEKQEAANFTCYELEPGSTFQIS